jgi:hypothetical protein
MLPSKPSFTTCMNVFGEIWTTHKSLGSLGTSSKGQTPRFHTPGSMQGEKHNWMSTKELLLCVNMQQNMVYI